LGFAVAVILGSIAKSTRTSFAFDAVATTLLPIAPTSRCYRAVSWGYGAQDLIVLAFANFITYLSFGWLARLLRILIQSTSATQSQNSCY
jgi:hypothetical protein